MGPLGCIRACAAVVALLALSAASGCARELSATGGISIKKARHNHCSSYTDGEGRWRREGYTLVAMLWPDPRTLPTISSVDMSSRYDFVISAEDSSRSQDIFRKALRETFGLAAKRETRQTPVKVLIRSDRVPLDLNPSATKGERLLRTWPLALCRHSIFDLLADALRPYEPTKHTFTNYTMSDLAHWLGGMLKAVVLDETDLKGQYDGVLVVDTKKKETLPDALRRIGLELRAARRPVEGVYVDRIPGARPPVRLKSLRKAPQVYPPWERPAAAQ